MALLLYSPGNKAAFQAESIGIVGKTVEEVHEEHRALITAGMQAVARGVISAAEVTQQLAKASPARLPAELVSRLLDPDYYDVPVMNTEMNLAMYAPREEGKPNLVLLSDRVKDIDDVVAEGRMDPDTLAHFVVRNAVTHAAIQYEPIVTGEGIDQRLNVRGHQSFGYMVGDLYLPIVTVLNSEHPVRQLIEQRRQEASAL